MGSTKTSAKVVTGCMIIIGNEILSGRTQDTNLNYLAKALNELGVRMQEARVIPDVAVSYTHLTLPTTPYV